MLYQAATWGRPVVASNLSEIKKLAFESDLQVEFFENGNIQSLCTSLRKLLDSKEIRCNQSTHNFNIIQHARPHETCQKYIQAFNHALEKRRSPKRITTPVTEQKPA